MEQSVAYKQLKPAQKRKETSTLSQNPVLTSFRNRAIVRLYW